MPVPVMTIVGSIRKELSLPARTVAAHLGITHGYLQQLEEYEYVLEPSYITQHRKPLGLAVEEFLESNLPNIQPQIKQHIKAIIPKVNTAMENDYSFHAISLATMQSVYISNTDRSVHGPLFKTVLEHYFAIDNNNVLLRSSGDIYIDYYINYVMQRFWGHRATQRRRHTRSTGIMYMPFDNNNGKYIGYFDGSNDPRSIFTLNPYSARRSYLPYLFLYLITNRLSFSYNIDNLPVMSKAKASENHTQKCAVVSNNCTDPSQCCHHINFISPGRKEIDFYYRPDGAGFFTHYCIRDVPNMNG